MIDGNRPGQGPRARAKGKRDTGPSPSEREALAALGLDPAPWEPQPGDRLGKPYRYPYHLGLYMAVNAIPGCFAIIDGPDCIYRKAEWIHGKHDLRSTLLDPCGRHRVVSTLLHSGEVIKSKGETVVRRLRRLGQLPETELVLINSMPHVQIIGTQYDALIARVEDQLDALIYEVPSRSLEADWTDGYSEVLTTLARRLPRPTGSAERGRIPGSVALIGLLLDRVEADHLANVAELERLVRGLELDPISTWLSNRPVSHLRRALEAETLVALPHGLAAAQALARRTGAQVVILDQPFGLEASARFVHRLGAATGREVAAERLVDAELSRVIPRFEWAASALLLGRRIAFSGDPTLFAGILDGASDFGMDVIHLSASVREAPDGVEASLARFGPVVPRLYAPTYTVLDRHLDSLARQAGLDLAIGGSQFPVEEPTPRDQHSPARMHFGFPNFFAHALHPSPFLGFEGWAWFVEQMLNPLTRRNR